MATNERAFDELQQLLKETDLQHEPIDDRSGFRLAISGVVEVNPILVAGEANVWLLTPLRKVKGLPEVKVLRAVNSLNRATPFGVYYESGNFINYRNTIRWERIRGNSRELMLFVLVSVGVMKDAAGLLGSLLADG